MTESGKRDRELEALLERTRKILRRSEELVRQTEQLVDESRGLARDFNPPHWSRALKKASPDS